MSRHRLWYIKVNDTARGPFPATQIRHNVLLGRLPPETLVSEDQQSWRPLRDLPALYDPEQAVDIARERRQLDERRQERRQNQQPNDESRRNSPDRRQPEDPELVQSRQNRQDVWHSLTEDRPNRLRIPIALSAIVAAIGAIAYLLPSQPQQQAVVDCSAAPQAGGSWDGCDLPAADFSSAGLQGASFAFAKLIDANFAGADLTGARLSGADLRRAQLQSARLRDADLSYVDLRDADLSGAELHGTRLSGAIWPDGTKCAKPSVGACLRAEVGDPAK